MTTTHSPKRTRGRPRRGTDPGTLARFKAEVKEIAEATEAMRRVRRGIEFEPPRLRYTVGPR
jgi:hypothetical protein